jgi:hypothetical protein
MESKLIKSEIEINYPCLMEYEDTKYNTKVVVLFKEKNCGTIISSNNERYTLGGYFYSWTMNCFKPFKGEIKLNNLNFNRVNSKYPLLGIYTNSSGNGEFVVLFFREGEGTVLNTENSDRKLGYYSKNWADDSFSDLYGEIILKN